MYQKDIEHLIFKGNLAFYHFENENREKKESEKKKKKISTAFLLLLPKIDDLRSIFEVELHVYQ